jgi:ribosomal protein S18 acetylase RimI-like enzyme
MNGVAPAASPPRSSRARHFLETVPKAVASPHQTPQTQTPQNPNPTNPTHTPPQRPNPNPTNPTPNPTNPTPRQTRPKPKPKPRKPCKPHPPAVLDREARILGCALLLPLGATPDGARVAELGAFCIDVTFRGTGRGDSLLDYVEQEARARGVTRLVLLTTRTADWFMQVGGRAREGGGRGAGRGGWVRERWGLCAVRALLGLGGRPGRAGEGHTRLRHASQRRRHTQRGLTRPPPSAPNRPQPPPTPTHPHLPPSATSSWPAPPRTAPCCPRRAARA